MDNSSLGSERQDDPRRPRRLPLWGRIVGVLAALALLFVLVSRFDLIPGFGDLFGEKTRDRTGPVLLKSIQDMHRYEGAAGNFQVVVDLEKDAKFLPDSIRGTRTLYVGAGTVSGYVDLGALDERSVTVNEDRTKATLRLPHAVLGRPPSTWTARTPCRSNAASWIGSGTCSPTIRPERRAYSAWPPNTSPTRRATADSSSAPRRTPAPCWRDSCALWDSRK